MTPNEAEHTPAERMAGMIVVYTTSHERHGDTFQEIEDGVLAIITEYTSAEVTRLTAINADLVKAFEKVRHEIITLYGVFVELGPDGELTKEHLDSTVGQALDDTTSALLRAKE